MKIISKLILAFRNRTRPITTIVLHATAGKSASSSIAWLGKIGYSYHAIIGDGTGVHEGGLDDGLIYKCVPGGKVAWHAGKSVGPNGPWVNGYSLGLSFASMDDRVDKITEAQWQAAIEWCALWIAAMPTIKHITTHAIISPGRKFDPKGPVVGIQDDGEFPLLRLVDEVNGRLLGQGVERSVQAWP